MQTPHYMGSAYPTWGRDYRNPINTHELQKHEIYSQGAQPAAPVIDTPSGMAPPPPQPSTTEVGLDDTYIHFDSLGRAASSVSVGEIEWSIGNLNRQQSINNCTQINIAPFFFPLILNSPTAPDYYFYRRVYMQISSVPATQGVQAIDNIQYHFAFDIKSVTSIAVELTPVNPNFYFRQPITDLSKFRVRFMVPTPFKAGLTPVTIPPDTLIVSAVPGSNPARFNILNGNVGALVDVPTLPATFPAVPYALALPVAIVVSDFNSADPNLNLAVGTVQGIFVDQLENMTQFSVSTLSFAGLVAPVQSTIVIGKNRIHIQARFSSINTATANYVKPMHY